MKIFGTDYDGVIINIEPQKADAFGHLLNRYWGVDKNEASQYWINGGGTSRRSKFDYFYKKLFGKELKDDDYKKIEAVMSNTLKNDFYPKVELMPYAKELLKFAREKFDFMFIASGVPMDEIKYLVNLNGVAEYFDFVLGTNEQYPSKREHFKEILKDKKVDVLTYITDSTTDIEVAKEFNSTTLALPINVPSNKLKASGADYICKDLKEAVTILDKVLAKK